MVAEQSASQPTANLTHHFITTSLSVGIRPSIDYFLQWDIIVFVLVCARIVVYGRDGSWNLCLDVALHYTCCRPPCCTVTLTSVLVFFLFCFPLLLVPGSWLRVHATDGFDFHPISYIAFAIRTTFEKNSILFLASAKSYSRDLQIKATRLPT